MKIQTLKRGILVIGGTIASVTLVVTHCNSTQNEIKNATKNNQLKLAAYDISKDELIKLSARMENNSIDSQTTIIDSLEKDKNFKQVFADFYNLGKKVATDSVKNIADTAQQKFAAKEYANKVARALKALNK